jgi:chorismate synthase
MALRYLTAGESHGPSLTAILEGLPAGLQLDVEVINQQLARRQRGYGAGPRMKIETDSAQILSGVMAGQTIGAPLAISIQNRDHERWRGKPIAAFTIPRPGHADLTATIKYGYGDLRPALERASARETAARVAVGAVCRHFLAQFDITIGGYVISIGDVQSEVDSIPIIERFNLAEANDIRCPDPESANLMRERIQAIMQARDTLGGVIEVIALGLPPGLGSHVHWDRKLDARLGAAVLGVQAMKGVEIGPAFDNTTLSGTQVQDPIHLNGKELTRSSNRAGGIEGGITNGQPLVIRAAMKPIATTLKNQPTVDLADGVETPTQYERSDFCPVPRAVPIIEAVVAYILADALIEKLGGDSLVEMLPRFETLSRANLDDLQMDNTDQNWWSE